MGPLMFMLNCVWSPFTKYLFFMKLKISAQIVQMRASLFTWNNHHWPQCGRFLQWILPNSPLTSHFSPSCVECYKCEGGWGLTACNIAPFNFNLPWRLYIKTPLHSGIGWWVSLSPYDRSRQMVIWAGWAAISPPTVSPFFCCCQRYSAIKIVHVIPYHNSNHYGVLYSRICLSVESAPRIAWIRLLGKFNYSI